MAKKKQNQPTSTTETNLTPKGMIKDSDASYMSKQNWNHARNAINNSIDGDVGVIGNEPANLECINVPYTIIGGIHLYGDIWAIFSTDNTDSEIGKFDDSRCEYETIVNDTCLNFNTDHLIIGVSKENYNCQWQLYWDDGLNPSRTLNIDDIPYIPDPSCTDPCDPCYTTNLDCDAIRLAPYMDVPCITLSKAEEGGSLVNGTYQAFIAYTLDNQVIGDYVGISNLQSLWNHSGPSGSLDINISNLDKDFDSFQLVIRYKTHNAILSKIVGYYSTEQTTINIDYLDGRLETITDLALIVRNPVYEKSDGMWVVNDYLIRSQPTEKFDFNYQPLANLIHAHWESWRYPSTYYANGGNKPSFMRDEQYAFFIRWIYNTGDKSKAYHIPGKPPGDVASNLPGYNPPPAPPLQTNDPLSVTGIDIAPNGSQELYFEGINTADFVLAADIGDVKDPKYGGIKQGEGHMGYWQSTELYPNDAKRWNSSHHAWSDFGGPEHDLCGQPIRHHKFPDETLQGTDAALLSPTVDGITGEWINILGVKFDNIYPPVDNNGVLIPGIVGYEILTGNRSGNKSILAKGIIRNMFTYERDTTTNGLSYEPPFDGTENGPRKIGRNWGVFPNYPYNDLHTDPYLINRDRGQLISNRPWYDGIEDNFLVNPSKHASEDDRGLAEITRDYFTFHSPDTMFSRMFLNPNEIKLYKTVRGQQLGNFKISEEHPRFKLIKKRAVFVAAIVGVGYAINQMRGPEDLSITGAGQNPAGMADYKALGSGTAMSPFPGVGNGISLINSIFHLGGMVGTYVAKLGLDTIIDGATVLGAGRDAKQIAIPTFNAAESAATGLTGAASGSEKTVTMRGTDFTGVPRIMAMITGIFAFLNYVATGGDKILDLIRNLVSYQDHVYKYISHGFYNEEVILPPLSSWGTTVSTDIWQPHGVGGVRDSAWRRSVEDARYIKQAFSAFPGNVMINNLRRQSTVVLSTQDLTGNGDTGPGGTVVSGTYGGLVDPNGNDFSKFTIGDGMCNDCQNPTRDDGKGATVTWYSPGVQTCKPIAANYAALKVNIDNQYGQIDNILMQPAGGDCNYFRHEALVAGQTITDNGGWSQVHFGGDVYINRYTEKTSMPFFWDFLKDGEPDGIAWDYKNYPNVPYPRYWLDSNKFRMDEYIKPITNLDFDWRGHTPGDLYHLDGPTAITCEGSSGTFSGIGNYDNDEPPTGGITASYDTTDETLIAIIRTTTTANTGVPGDYVDHKVESVETLGWANGAWELPEDGSGVACTCSDCFDPICVGGANPCLATCLQPNAANPPANNGNLFDNFASANNVYTTIMPGTPWNNSYITFQATTCNDQAKAWSQPGAVQGTGGQANGAMPTVTDANGDPIFKWHQNYSVLNLTATVNLTINIKSSSQNTISFNGVTDVVTITHPDDPTDVRDVQGIISGEYDRGTLENGGSAISGALNNKTAFEVDGLGIPNRAYYINALGLVCSACQDFGQMFDDQSGAEDPGYVNQTMTLEATIDGLAAVYDWNTGAFQYVCDNRYSWLVAQGGGDVTPVPIPSGDPTNNTDNELLPKENFDSITVRHGSYVSNSRSCPGGGCWNIHVMESDLFGYMGGDGSTTGYKGQDRSSFTMSISGGTPVPTSFNDVDYELEEPPYEAATDTDNSGGVFVVTEHYMYTHNNGVQDFFVESEINLAYRDYSDSIMTRHYDYLDYTDINTMFDAKVQDIDNYYKYDKSLSQKRFWNTSFGEIQPRWYDPYISETCLTKYTQRLIYSLPVGGVTLKQLKQQKKEANKDFWRIFLSKNYRDFKSSVNTIKPINKTGSIVLFPKISPQMFQGIDALQMDKAGTKLIIGDGGLFGQAFQNVANSDLSHEYGSCESSRSVVNTPMGLYFVSQAQGKIFKYGSKGLEPISDQGMKWWFNKYLPSRLINALPDVEDCPTVADNPVTGIGVQSVYDPMNDIIYFSKKDYEPTTDCLCYVPCEGFYVDNDCLAGIGSGSGCGGGITGVCPDPTFTFNPITMQCEETIWIPCPDDANDCPPGYQTTGPAVNGCRCCADDSTGGFGIPNVIDPSGNNTTDKGCLQTYYHAPTSIITPNTSPVTLGDPDYFEDASWTVSYDPKSNAWISFHDWHPDLTFNSINHFLTSKDSGTDCPPDYVWDPVEKLCCKIAETIVPRLTNLNVLQMPGGSGAGTPSCIDAILTGGAVCPLGFDIVLPCGQNVAGNYQTTVCGQSNCSCSGNGSNQSLQTFRNSCETTMGQYTSWDDGTPCPTAQEIFDYEYDTDGSPNGLTYVDPGFCLAECKNCTDPIEGTSIWRHNTRTDLYANFYGIDYPWEVDLIEHSGQSVATIRSLEYQLESYVYQNESKDRFHDLDWNFDEAIIYNTEQVSGLLRLNITPKNNPVLASTFPIIGGGFIDILYSKEEQKYRFNQFWDITNDRGEFTATQQAIFNTQWNGYIRNLNAANLNYNKAQTQRKKFRHYYNHVLLRRVRSENRKMLLRLNNTKLNISMR